MLACFILNLVILYSITFTQTQEAVLGGAAGGLVGLGRRGRVGPIFWWAERAEQYGPQRRLPEKAAIRDDGHPKRRR